MIVKFLFRLMWFWYFGIWFEKCLIIYTHYSILLHLFCSTLYILITYFKPCQSCARPKAEHFSCETEGRTPPPPFPREAEGRTAPRARPKVGWSYSTDARWGRIKPHLAPNICCQILYVGKIRTKLYVISCH